MNKRLWQILAGLFFVATAFAANFVYIVNGDGTILILNAADNSEVATVTASGVPGTQVGIVISPDGRRLYACGWMAADVVSVFDVDPTSGLLTMVGGMPVSFPGAQPFNVAISPDSSIVYITFPGSLGIGMYDRDLNPLMPNISTAPNQPHGIAISPSGDRIYVNYTNNDLVDLFTSTLGHSLGGPVSSGGTMPGGSPYFVAVSASGAHVYVSNAAGSRIARFDQDLLNPIDANTDLSAPFGIAINPADSIIYVANNGNSSIAVLNSDLTQNHLPLPTPPGVGSGSFITALNPEGTHLYLTYGMPASQSLKIYDVATYTATVVNYPFPINQYGIAFTPSTTPRNLIGVQKTNDFGLFFEIFNHLQWSDAPANIAGFYIYRDGVQIAVLGGFVREYDDHNIEPGVSHTYEVTAFDFTGTEDSPSTVVVN